MDPHRPELPHLPTAAHPAPRRRLRPGRRSLVAHSVALLLCTALPGWAQEDAPALAKPVYAITPRISVSETFTNNVDLAASNRRSEQITEVSPGIRITRESGRVVGYFDYALRALAYAQSTHDTSYLHALSTAGQADLARQWLFLDFSGDISQSAVAALGPLPGLGAYSPANRTEVSRYRLSPFVQGTLGNAVDYNARLSRSITHANTSLASDVGESLSSLSLASASSLSRVGWVADASRYNIDYSAGRATEADQTNVGLRMALTPQLNVVLKVGREYSNYTTLDKRSYDTRDLILAWQPSPQWQANGSWGRRSFGDVHALNLSYQSARFAVRLSDRRDIAAVPGQLVPVLLLPASAPALPGSGPAVPVIGYFVTTAVALQDRQELSLSLLGVRDTLTLGFSQSNYTRLDRLAPLADELARSDLRQALLSLDYKHRLTPRYDLDVLAAVQKAAPGADQENVVLRQVGISLTGKVWRQGSATVGLRHSASTGAVVYDESALTLGLQVEF